LAFVQNLAVQANKEDFSLSTRSTFAFFWPSVEHERRFVEALTQLVYAVEDFRPTYNPAFEASPSGKIKQHDAKQNCQHSLAGHAWEREQDADEY
jgi:hypothetical protein